MSLTNVLVFFFSFCHSQSYVLLMVMARKWIIYVVSALRQRVWAWSSAQPHTSAQLQAKLFDLGLASPSAALPPFPLLPPQGLAEFLRRQFQPIPNPLLQPPTVCQHGPAAYDTQTAWRRQHSTEKPPLRGGLLLCCFEPILFQGITAKVHTLAWLWSSAFSQKWLKS